MSKILFLNLGNGMNIFIDSIESIKYEDKKHYLKEKKFEEILNLLETKEIQVITLIDDNLERYEVIKPIIRIENSFIRIKTNYILIKYFKSCNEVEYTFEDVEF